MKFWFLGFILFFADPSWSLSPSPRGPADLETTVRTVCAKIAQRLNNTPDQELTAAAHSCAVRGPEAALDLTRGLSRLANKDAATAGFHRPSDRLPFLAAMLEPLREALVKSSAWRRPPALFDVGRGIRELSGFALDRRRQALFGISDELPQLLRISLNTRKIEFFHIDGLNPVDVEAVLIGPDGKVWMMDVGDNKGKRDEVAVHIVDPDRAQNGRIPLERSFAIRYPDNKRPNVEASFIQGGRLFLIEKTLYKPAEIFALPLNSLLRGVLNAQSVGWLPAGSPISDAAFDEASGRLFVLGWFDLREVVGWQRGPRTSRPIFEDFFGQQEAVALDLRLSAFYVGTEEGAIHLVPAR